MLTPEQIARLPKPLIEYLQGLEDYILVDMARRMEKTGQLTDTAKILKRKAEDLLYIKNLEARLAEQMGVVVADVERIMREAAKTNMDIEKGLFEKVKGFKDKILGKNDTLDRLLEGIISQTKGEVINFTGTQGFIIGGEPKTLSEAYIHVMDQALLRSRTGASSWNTEIRRGIGELAAKGIEFVSYESGWHNKLDVAVRRAMVTGINQVANEQNMYVAKMIGAQFVEVSAHVGARPTHAIWQGGVYSLKGNKDGYKDFRWATGYGTGEGLGGWNCRHGFHGFFPEISNRTWTDEQLKNIDPPPFNYHGKDYTAYTATQNLRRMEAKMRSLKRQVMVADEMHDEHEFIQKALNYQKMKYAYFDFAKAAGLKAQAQERGFVYGWSRTLGGKVRWSNETWHKGWLKAIGAEGTTLDTVKKYYAAKSANSLEYRLLIGYGKEIKQGNLSPLAGFDFYFKTYNESVNTLVGLKTRGGRVVTDIGEHFTGRLVGGCEYKKRKGKEEWERKPRLSVSVDDAKEALQKGLEDTAKRKVKDGDLRFLYEYGKIDIVISEIGRLVTVIKKGN